MTRDEIEAFYREEIGLKNENTIQLLAGSTRFLHRRKGAHLKVAGEELNRVLFRLNSERYRLFSGTPAAVAEPYQAQPDRRMNPQKNKSFSKQPDRRLLFMFRSIYYSIDARNFY